MTEPKIDKDMRLSKSAIESYLYCEYSFYLKYIIKFKTPPNLAMTRGTTFHSFCEKFYDRCVEYPPEEWEKLIDKSLPQDEQEYQAWFINEERERYFKLKTDGKEDLFTPVYREVHLNSPALKLHGYIDAIRWVDKEKKTFALVEYKTSKSYKPGNVKRELAYYRMLWDDTMKDKGTITHTIIMNPQCKINDIKKVSVRNMNAAKKAIAKVRAALANEEFDKPMNMFKCEYCGLCKLFKEHIGE